MARPEFKPTAAQRRQVSILAAAKMSEEQIAAALDISRGTLRKHFEQELLAGKSKRNAAVIMATYKAAVNGNVSAQRLWTKMAGLDLPGFDAPEDQAEDGQGEAPKPPKSKRRGKKELAQEAAKTAGAGTEWGDDLGFSGRVN